MTDDAYQDVPREDPLPAKAAPAAVYTLGKATDENGAAVYRILRVFSDTSTSLETAATLPAGATPYPDEGIPA